MSLFEVVSVGLGTLLGCYVLARLIFTAYFISKRQHERNTQHGTQSRSGR